MVCNGELDVSDNEQHINERCGQSISIMNSARLAQRKESASRFCFFSNLKTIRFMSFTALLELLACSPAQLGYEPPPKFIKFNGSDVKALKALGAGANSEVYLVEKESDKYALKRSKHFCSDLSEHLVDEAANIAVLRQKLEQNASIIPSVIDLDLTGECMLISPAGTSLLARIDSEVNDAISGSELKGAEGDRLVKIRLGLVQKWSKHWLLALSQIHQLGKVCHNDMRPHNVIFYNSNVVIIDWECMSTIGQSLYMFRCNVYFMADRILIKYYGDSPEANVQSSRVDDLETMAYGMMYMLKDGNLPWTTVKVGTSFDEVGELITTRKLSMESYGGFLSRFYLAVKEISGIPKKEDYDRLLAILSD
ncbi:hypothetical protein HDU76_006590 [Blyttiomyces sp. JEL0837]|nr:hypothetical protein HDU76_006590 [Blyttiomyces sp. JEL0837]